EENGCLLAKLAQEKQERSKLLDQMTVRHVDTERIHQKKREQLTEEIQKLSEDNGTMKEKVRYLQDRVAEAEKRLIDRQEEIAHEMDKRLTLSILESDARFRAEQRSLQDELEKKTKQYEDMERRCHSLERKLKKAQDEDNEKYEEAEKEFRKMKIAMKDKDDLIEREREELRNLVQDLTNMVKQHKARIVELTEINKQQEIVLKSQSQSIDSKEEQMEMSYREVEALQRKCMELEDQASVLKKSLEELQIMKQESDSIFEEKASKERRSFEERQAVLEKDVQECRRTLEAEKDKLLIKDKIIDDQTGTIRQLKSAVQDKSEEVRKVIRDKEQVEKELTQEKQYRLKLAGEVSKVRWRKEQLKQKVSDLEDDLRSSERMDTSEMVKQQERLVGLEKQVESKQKEWELQLKLLTKEKEQAVNAAKFATQKLLETVTEFQKQVASNKKVQQSLAKLLSEKDAQLIAATEKVESLSSQLTKQSTALKHTSWTGEKCEKGFHQNSTYIARQHRYKTLEYVVNIDRHGLKLN
ncbi:unnamed protein product, partial [Timema podura]|nr:unnamed protein product [Timema podura]